MFNLLRKIGSINLFFTCIHILLFSLIHFSSLTKPLGDISYVFTVLLLVIPVYILHFQFYKANRIFSGVYPATQTKKILFRNSIIHLFAVICLNSYLSFSHSSKLSNFFNPQPELIQADYSKFQIIDDELNFKSYDLINLTEQKNKEIHMIQRDSIFFHKQKNLILETEKKYSKIEIKLIDEIRNLTNLRNDELAKANNLKEYRNLQLLRKLEVDRQDFQLTHRFFVIGSTLINLALLVFFWSKKN